MTIMVNFKKSNEKPICYSSSTTFNSTRALETSINKAKYDISVVKIQNTNKWKVSYEG